VDVGAGFEPERADEPVLGELWGRVLKFKGSFF